MDRVSAKRFVSAFAASLVMSLFYAASAHALSCTPSATPQSTTTTATAGTFRITASNVSGDTTSMLFPTWGDPGWQDDLVWYNGINAGGGTWYADVNLGNHKAGAPEYGTFYTHVYAYGPSGSVLCAATTWSRVMPAPPPPPPPTCNGAAAPGSPTSATSGTFRIYAYNVANTTSMLFPTWGAPGWQDDLVWYNGVNAGGGTWYADVNLANHRAGAPEYGTFYTHVYAYGSGGSSLCAATTWSRVMPPPPPTCNGAAAPGSPTSATSGTFRIYAYNVANATSMQFPTWGEPGWQDDLVWYNGVNAGGGTWYADVNLANHKAGAPEFGTFYTHVYAYGSGGSSLCSATTWSRLGTPPLAAQFVGWSVPDQMGAGARHLVSITMRNTGTETWQPGVHNLGSQNPQDNWTWGRSRTYLSGPVAPGQLGVFGFDITGARPAGSYGFQWRMVKENVAWFGDSTPALAVDTFVRGDLFGSLTAVNGSYIQGILCWTSRPWLTTTAYVYHKFNSFDPDDEDIPVGQTPANGPGIGCGYSNKGFTFYIPDTRSDGIWLKDGRSHWLITRAIDTPNGDGDYVVSNSYQYIPLPDTRPDRSEFVSQTIPPVSTNPSQTPFSITFRNSGTNVWYRSTHTLRPVAPGEPWSVGVGLSLPTDVAPGQSVTFSYTPNFSRGGGTYVSVWQMARSQVEFGAKTPAAETIFRTSNGTGGLGQQPSSQTPVSPLPYDFGPPATPVLDRAPPA